MSKKLFAIFNVNKPSIVAPVCTNVTDDTDPDDSLSSQGSITTVESTKVKCVDLVSETCDLGTLLTGPSRPVLESYPKTVFGKQNRGFNSVYYSSFNWLEYSIKRDAIYCFCCRNFSIASDNNDFTFTSIGFNNWKKAIIRVKRKKRK
ncbi:uncharacterized protein LOC112595601 [Melanaphis sacchari]|uniref:uncharacterized protein LOC112595601 n=1 Tax=Melanaphis sacchari TaxID=742174 RepID=UPI000DC1322C|nr:uncharacterized protein LOC112595601 [Melanaphis sacchari]